MTSCAKVSACALLRYSMSISLLFFFPLSPFFFFFITSSSGSFLFLFDLSSLLYGCPHRSVTYDMCMCVCVCVCVLVCVHGPRQGDHGAGECPGGGDGVGWPPAGTHHHGPDRGEDRGRGSHPAQGGEQQGQLLSEIRKTGLSGDWSFCSFSDCLFPFSFFHFIFRSLFHSRSLFHYSSISFSCYLIFHSIFFFQFYFPVLYFSIIFPFFIFPFILPFILLSIHLSVGCLSFSYPFIGASLFLVPLIKSFNINSFLYLFIPPFFPFRYHYLSLCPERPGDSSPGERCGWETSHRV